MTNSPAIRDEGRERPYDLEERTALFGEAPSNHGENLPGVMSMDFEFKASDFFRAWVFRHSDFRAHSAR